MHFYPQPDPWISGALRITATENSTSAATGSGSTAGERRVIERKPAALTLLGALEAAYINGSYSFQGVALRAPVGSYYGIQLTLQSSFAAIGGEVKKCLFSRLSHNQVTQSANSLINPPLRNHHFLRC